MKTVSILVLETCIPASVVDPLYMFNAVNEFYKTAGLPPFFKVQLVGLQESVTLNGGQITIRPDASLAEAEESDLVIIPAISGDIKEALTLNQTFIPWIKDQYHGGAEVASLCIGAFLLASTQLLNGKSCSTHWLHASHFRELYPQVHLISERVITDQAGLYTSGGATSYWNLLLYLVEKYTSREMAITASKFFLLDIEKTNQLPFTIFRGQKEHGDELILAAQDYIEKNFAEKLSIDQLADRYRLGRRTLERRFKKSTDNTLVEYIQRVKIEAAKKQLETGRKTVSEVMYDVGYTDNKAFREVFKRYTSLSPVDYRKKYSKSIPFIVQAGAPYTAVY